MLRLRREFDRALQHPWIGPIAILCLAILLALLLLHGVGDATQADGVLLCLAMATVFMSFVARRTALVHRAPLDLRAGRGPPVPPRRPIRAGTAAVTHPLRR